MIKGICISKKILTRCFFFRSKQSVERMLGKIKDLEEIKLTSIFSSSSGGILCLLDTLPYPENNVHPDQLGLPHSLHLPCCPFHPFRSGTENKYFKREQIKEIIDQAAISAEDLDLTHLLPLLQNFVYQTFHSLGVFYFSNSMVNPLLYSIMSERFRRSFNELRNKIIICQQDDNGVITSSQ